MTSSADRIMMKILGLPRPSPVILGTFISSNGTDCIVNIGDVSITVPAVGLSSPTVNMPVRLQRNRAGQLVILGPAAPQSLGSVSDPNTIPKPGQLPTLLDFRTRVRASDSGRFVNSAWGRNDPAADMTSTGAWFYGTRIQNYLKGWTPLTMQIYLPNLEAQGVCRMGHHAYGSKPAGWTGSTAEFTPTSISGWVDVPVAFATYLRDNVGGITVTSGNGLNRWKGTATDPLSGAVRFTAHR